MFLPRFFVFCPAAFLFHPMFCFPVIIPGYRSIKFTSPLPPSTLHFLSFSLSVCFSLVVFSGAHKKRENGASLLVRPTKRKHPRVVIPLRIEMVRLSRSVAPFSLFAICSAEYNQTEAKSPPFSIFFSLGASDPPRLAPSKLGSLGKFRF